MTAEAPQGLRERKKADTRRALSDAALKLALEKGVDQVTREAIAAVAGVSLRTFNNYFTGKYEALAYRQTERLRRGVDALRARPAGEPLWTSVTEAMLAPLEAELAENPGDGHGAPSRAELAEIRKMLMNPEIRSAISKDLFDEWVHVIAERSGTDPDHDMYPRLVAAVMGAVGDAAMEAYARADPPVAITTLYRQGMAAVAAGLPQPNVKENARG
jgi:AcrR family transcriptional regulator